MHLLFKGTCLTLLASAAWTSQADAYCARCTKIESERAQEQAAHPQPAGYYDDKYSKELSLNTDVNSTSAKSLEWQTQSTSPFSSKEQNKLGNENLSDAHAISQQDYSTVLTILQTKNFLSTLSDSFTLFIPSNEAFRHLGIKGFQELLRPENHDQLSAFVSSHVVANKILKKDFNNNVKTLNGQNLTMRSNGDELTVNGAHVLRTEPAGNKGIIYIIDSVLTP